MQLFLDRGARLNHDLFGKPALSEEDAYRLESIRQNRQLVQRNGAGISAEDFLSKAQATITIEYNPSGFDRRVVELVNKTNQEFGLRMWSHFSILQQGIFLQLQAQRL